MSHPEFFDRVPGIKLIDPLARFLGASGDGVLEYRYVDAVKLAGHSCPTVASAYWLTCTALAALSGTALPERGAIRVSFQQDRANGVTGVIANVVSMLTGAAGDGGFKGIGGRFDRRDLLEFNAQIPLQMRFTRTDDGTSADVAAHLSHVPADPEQAGLLQRWVAGQSTAEETRRFGVLWQERVRCILIDHADNPAVFEIRLIKPHPGHEDAAAFSSPPCYAGEFPGYFGETQDIHIVGPDTYRKP